MKKLVVFIPAAVATMVAFAAPVVENVLMTQDAGRTVNITYMLKNEPGIVTVDIQTNTLANGSGEWVSIGGKYLTYFSGDANRLVQPSDSESRKITWKPCKAWPDNKVTGNVRAEVSAWATNAPPDYMVVSLAIADSVRYYVSADTVPFGVTDEMYKTEYLVMRKCHAANVEWRMGSPSDEKGRASGSAEKPHLVTLSKDYYLGVYPVTQRQYELIMGTNPSAFTLASDYATRPVEKVTYADLRGKTDSGYDWPGNGHAVVAKGFIAKLRTHSGLNGFDLPTEAQWEFACRAGCGSALYSGKEIEDTTTSDSVAELARYKGNSNSSTSSSAPTDTAETGTAKVGSYKPNAWGLYDMYGNVWEWCLDWYQSSTDGVNAETGPTSGDKRVTRGGSWSHNADICRSASRAGFAYDTFKFNYGFRMAYHLD